MSEDEKREILPATPLPPNPFSTGQPFEREPEPKPGEPPKPKPKGPAAVKAMYTQWDGWYGKDLSNDGFARSRFPQLTQEMRKFEREKPHYIVSRPVLPGGHHKLILNPEFDWQ